ncbi:type III-A CRISPR-associated protein Cas10/Csm1 [Patescibacteria group bacterium]|nr:type III-A CRISPR-associated protein Cas10/Csm1 [Patescibacteria group bacterium]
MTEKEANQREYQSVVLAALLHDIGKFLQRGNAEYQGTHENASGMFFEKFEPKLKNDNLYDLELVKFLAKYHNPKIKKELVLKDDYCKNKSEGEKEKTWKFVTLTKDADSYSCKEREIKQPKRKGHGREVAPLDSIFSQIILEKKNNHQQIKEETDSQPGYYRYRINLINPLSSFPKRMTALEKNEISNYVKTFEDNLPDFSKLTTFGSVLTLWLSLLEQYTWCIPSDARYEKSDVSLFDHLRSTSAIAACLFKRHVLPISEGEKTLKRKNEFILIGGDFSGIQHYIYDVTNKGSGGAAKRLRARSFFITAFVETTIHKILHRLDLPLTCNLFSAGGKFLLLAPNINDPRINEVEKNLKDLRAEISEEILNTFFNQFTFTLSWIPIKGFKEEFKIYNFFKTADDIFYELEKEKFKKSKSVLISKGKWDIEKFKATEIYKEYKGREDCRICGKGPAIYQDEDIKTCFICKRDKSVIGEVLPKTKYIGFGKGYLPDKENQKDPIRIFHHNKEREEDFDYYIKLLTEEEIKDKEFYLIYNIMKEDERKEVSEKEASLRKYLANYVPKKNGKIESFEELAKCSLWEDKNRVEKKGSELLGILKADFDNLGLIFSKGFEIPSEEEKKLPDRDRKTMSRYLTLSRMIDLFFSGWMREVMEKNDKKQLISSLGELENIEDKKRLKRYLDRDEINFSKIYTVYSGGDDLVLVGPWETMIIFSLFLNIEFRRFTCNNDDITLSAGLAVAKPKHPIAAGIREANELLEKSKREDKNRITLFGTTVEWEQFPELMGFFLFLNQALNKINKDNPKEKAPITSGFVYRLLEYHNMATEYFEEERVEGLKFLSALSYDIDRNVIKRDRAGNIKEGKDEALALQRLMNMTEKKNSLIYNLKIPVFWALYRNRKVT